MAVPRLGPGTLDEPGTSRFDLSLLGCFALVRVDGQGDGQGDQCRGGSAQRLVALLALRAPVSRQVVAGLLWPNVPERSAQGALRAALARLARSAHMLVRASAHELSLGCGVSVDFHRAWRLASRLIDANANVDLDDAIAAMPLLTADLLPGWYDDWVIDEAERWRQLRLHGLESLAAALCDRRRFGQALTVAGAAVAADPLRESSRAAAIRVHLAEGNRSEALREFERYRHLTRRDLRTEPTERLRRLVSPSP